MQSAKKTYDGKIAGLYDLEETLGRGHFAVVKLARHVFTGEKVAVKVIDKTKLDDVSKAHLFQEVRCMKLVQHPNVVRLYEVIDTQTKLYLILELGDGGDLYDYIMKHEAGLGEDMAREYFRQIVRAISYCHQLHVVHRDLKPENVVFFERLGVVKLTDFGFSNKFYPGQKLETSCGSLAYSAPEILLGDSYDAPAVDVWSLGVILYMLVVGQAPFQEANDSETLTMIMDCKYTIPTHISDSCKRLIARMLVREPELRANLADIASDPWLGGPPQVEYLPLVSRHQVTEEDHNIIINKMVNGNIATKEEVLEALDRNEYNHITATYFLLAERKLRADRQEQTQNRVKQNQILINITSGSKNSLKTSPSDAVTMDTLQIPSATAILSIPRTPGDASQGRTRKCSIVQEEEDEEEYCTNPDERELTPPHSSLNRRGSRSEGKLNIAIQERIAEERRKEKKESPNSSPHPTCTGRLPAKDDATCWPTKRSSPTSIHSGISTSYIPGSTKWRMGTNKKSPVRNSSLEINNVQNKCITGNLNVDAQSASVMPAKNVNLVWANECGVANLKSKENVLPFIDENTDKVMCSSQIKSTAKSIPTKPSLVGDNSEFSTVSLSDSATVTIPVHSTQVETKVFPKFKTMPSPTRPSQTILPSHLYELKKENIKEFNSPNSAEWNGGENRVTNRIGITGINYEQRRSKFRNARTASCSSSDASDDDSESRKKRAHKLSAEKNSQRRDSHDDSSDSQDRRGDGGGGGGGGGAGANPNSALGSAGDGVHNQNRSDTNQQNRSSGSGDHDGNRSSNSRRQCSGETFRRSRRRTAETRLRESQSLNRITEVQESEGHSAVSTIDVFQERLKKKGSEDCINRDVNVRSNNNYNNNNNYVKNINKNNSSTHVNSNNNNNNNNNHNHNHNNNNNNNNSNSNKIVLNMEKNKSVKSLGARFLQSWSNTISSSKLSVNKRKCSLDDKNSRGNNHTGCAPTEEQVPKHDSEEKENKMLMEKSEKKVKLLGKYFQVSKKLCLPLPNLITKGRLYKARSCGSISKDRIIPSLSAGTSASGRCRRETNVIDENGTNDSSAIYYFDRCKSPNILMNQSLDSIDDAERKAEIGSVKSNSKNIPPIQSRGRRDDSEVDDIYAISDPSGGCCRKDMSSSRDDGSKCPVVGLCQMHMKDTAKCHLS